MLAPEKFAKMIAFLKSPACCRVRTNNHVERVNRKLRHQEKARYKWRKRRRLVRFLVLLLDRWWSQERAVRDRWREEPERAEPGRSSSKPPPRRRIAGQAVGELSGSARSVEKSGAKFLPRAGRSPVQHRRNAQNGGPHARRYRADGPKTRWRPP